MKKRVLFYCQHILGMGHLVRSMEIVRGLLPEFQVCFINGGEVVKGFEIPPEVEVVNLPAIKTDAEFRTLQPVDQSQDLASLQAMRTQTILTLGDLFNPDILMVELFPFGRRKFSFELIPLLEQAKSHQTKVVCSLRDIVVTKQDLAKHEAKVCKLMNQYFDLLLVHGDRHFQPLEETFSRLSDLTCETHYTGYVVQPQPEEIVPIAKPAPLILASIGGGRFGHELLYGLLAAAPILAQQIPHRIQIFTGPFMPQETFDGMTAIAQTCPNVSIDRFTPHLLTYMKQADLSISMSGYNTTMNILTTGVRAMLLPFTGNDDQEQTLRSQKLARLGVVEVLAPEDLGGDRFAQKILRCLQTQQAPVQFDFDGVQNTAALLGDLAVKSKAA